MERVPENAEVKAYLEGVPAERKGKVDTLHSLVVKLFPDALVDMRYKMPTYTVGEGWVAIAGPLVELDVRTLYLKDLTLIGCTFQDDEVFENLWSRRRR